MIRFKFVFCTILFLSLSLSAKADVKTVDRQGAKLDFSAYDFKDEAGNEVQLSEFFQPKKPVFLVPAFYECAGVCTVTLNRLFEDLQRLRFNPGRALQVVVFSINPDETPELAQKKKAAYLKRFKYQNFADGFHFLTGQQDEIQKLTSDLGFYYERSGRQFAHPAAIYLMTPEGKISKLLTGMKTSTKVLHKYVFEAANGRRISSFEKMALACKAAAPK